MGKDGAGGSGGPSESITYKQLPTTTIYDVHILTIRMLDTELSRLHRDLDMSVGDPDIIQVQITNVINELIQLSDKLGTAETDIENSKNS